MSEHQEEQHQEEDVLIGGCGVMVVVVLWGCFLLVGSMMLFRGWGR